MQLLRDNLTLWTSDMNDNAAGKEEESAAPAAAAAPAEEAPKVEAA